MEKSILVKVQEFSGEVPGHCGSKENPVLGTFLVVQWIRVCLPMQGTQVGSLLWGDPTWR